MTRIDLHTHSTFSDGAFTPRELVMMASEIGLEALAICDHDTIKGQEQALAAGAEFGLKVITGVELSVDHEDGSLHLLGYGFDYHHPGLLATLDRMRRSREERNILIVARLNKLGYGIKLKDVLRFTSEGTYGRAHIAQALAEGGWIPTMQEAFDKLLKRGRPAYLERWRLSLVDAIAALHQAGGIAVWGHPGLDNTRLEDLIARLPKWVEQGLDGIESDYHDHTQELRDRLRGLAKKYGIIYTGGSDFHGGIKPDNKLGEGAGGGMVGGDVLRAVEERVTGKHG